MGLSIVLQTESGEQLDRVDDTQNVLHGLLPEPSDPKFVHLGVIDWYGDTIFNYLQAPLFRAEWKRLAESADERHAPLLQKIAQLAERVERERLYLKFIGD